MGTSLDNDLLGDVFHIQNFVLAIVAQSGAGKGTLAKGIVDASEYVGRPVFVSETGQLFRDAIPKFSFKMRERLDEIQTSGRLQSGVIATSLWANNLLRNWEGIRKSSLIIDGSPRSELEALNLIDFTSTFLGRKLRVVHLKMDDDLAERRLLERLQQEALAGKPRPEVADQFARRRKLDFYHSSIVPMVEAIKVWGPSKVILHEVEVLEATTKQQVLENVLRFCRDRTLHHDDE